VGGGPAGLVTTKELREEGHDVICFERASSIGGVFRFDPRADTVSVWRGCTLTSSILVTNFSDFFPGSSGGALYEHRQYSHGEYVAYLESYVDHHALRTSLRFGHTVVAIERSAAGWRVDALGPTGAKESFQVDAVAVCTGLHQRPNRPTWDGLPDFPGTVMHSSEYKGNPEVFAGRSVLVVGGGESAEIVSAISSRADRTVLSLRRGAFILPRRMRGYPNDYFGTRQIYSLPSMFVRSSSSDDAKLRRYLGAALLPVRLPLIVLRQLLRRSEARRHDATSLTNRAERIVMSMRTEVGGTQFESFATKSEAFAQAIACGACELRPGLLRFAGRIATFEDGSELEVDTIVLCTGYAPPTFPFLKFPVTLSELDRFCIDRSAGAPLAFIGFVRPNIGAMPPMAEMQARWFTATLDGATDEPGARMPVRLQVDRPPALRELGDRLPTLVDFSSYMDELAELVGCKPTTTRIGFRPGLLARLYFAPFCSAQYRLVGPHAEPETARRVLQAAPMHVDPPRLLDLAAATIAGWLGVDRLRPTLTLFKFKTRRLEVRRRLRTAPATRGAGATRC
jgi:dimethylaniline monooxygenase (N-oxide forming)